MKRKPLAVASLGFLALTFGACDQGITRGVAGRNETDTKLHFAVDVAGTTYPLGPTLDPGESTLLVSGAGFGQGSLIADERCTKGDLVALNDDGREVARHPPPLCVGDVWTITAPNILEGVPRTVGSAPTR